MKRLWFGIIALVIIVLAVIWWLGVLNGLFRPTGEQTRFGRPLVVQFPTYGGYAPGILYNKGLVLLR